MPFNFRVEQRMSRRGANCFMAWPKVAGASDWRRGMTTPSPRGQVALQGDHGFKSSVYSRARGTRLDEIKNLRVALQVGPAKLSVSRWNGWGIMCQTPRLPARRSTPTTSATAASPGASGGTRRLRRLFLGPDYLRYNRNQPIWDTVGAKPTAHPIIEQFEAGARRSRGTLQGPSRRVAATAPGHQGRGQPRRFPDQ